MSTQRAKVIVSSEDLISIPQAARQLGVNPSTVYRWIYKGLVTPFRLGTQVFITSHDLNALKEDRQKHNR